MTFQVPTSTETILEFAAAHAKNTLRVLKAIPPFQLMYARDTE